MIKTKKLGQADIVYTCGEVKGELYESINEENMRSNTDNAKKRAVLQGMDYDGFRQMVLGANLMPMKTKEFNSIAEKIPALVLNPSTTTFNHARTNLVGKENAEGGTTLNLGDFMMNLSSELLVNNFRDFKKKIDETLKSDLDSENTSQLLRFLQIQAKENLRKIFSLDFDIQYFLKIVDVLDWKCEKEFFPRKETENILFVLKFLLVLSEIKEFKMMVPGFLNAKEKKKFFDFILYFESKCLEEMPESLEDLNLLKTRYNLKK